MLHALVSGIWFLVLEQCGHPPEQVLGVLWRLRLARLLHAHLCGEGTPYRLESYRMRITAPSTERSLGSLVKGQMQSTIKSALIYRRTALALSYSASWASRARCMISLEACSASRIVVQCWPMVVSSSWYCAHLPSSSLALDGSCTTRETVSTRTLYQYVTEVRWMVKQNHPALQQVGWWVTLTGTTDSTN